MNKLTFSLASSVILLSLSSLALSSTNLSADFKKIKDFFIHPSHKKNHVDLLFLQQADSGSIAPMSDKPGCYSLTLSNLHQNVLYFTDQPRRNAGNISNREFLAVWQHNTIKPNVAMQAFAVSPNDVQEVNLVATLQSPNYDQKTKTLTYTACLINKDKKQSTPQIKKADLRSVNLFIDPLHNWPP